MDDSLNISHRPFIRIEEPYNNPLIHIEEHNSFERSACFVQEKLFSGNIPNPKSNRRNSVYVQTKPRHSFLRISPMKVPLQGKETSDFLDFSHKPINIDIFPIKSFRRNIEIPMKFLNPFYKDHLILQNIVKIEKSFFQLGIYFEIKAESPENFKILHLSNAEQAEETLNRRMEEWQILIKLSQFRETPKFTEEIHLTFKRFLEIFLSNQLFSWEKTLKFLYNRGFSLQDQKIILQKSLNLFKLEKCRIILKDSSEKTLENQAESFDSISPLRYSLTGDGFSSENDKIPENCLKNQLKSQETIFKRPNHYIVTFEDSIKTLTHYNTIKFLNRMTYYLRIALLNQNKFIRVNFINPDNGNSHIKVSYYEPMNAIREYCIVINERDIEKIINVLQISGEKVKRKILNMYLNIRNDLVGRKPYFFKEWPIRKSSTSPNNQSLITKQNWQALKLITISQHNDPFIKTFYESKTFFEPFKLDILGKCYVKITYYKPNEKFMSNLDLKQKVFFKFEFFPYSSKTKVYKFLISLFDINDLLQIKLRFENERVLILSLNRLILKRLRLIKCDLYHTLMLPSHEFSFHNKKFLNYRMKFRKMAYEDKEIVTFLQKEYASYRTIFHIIKKIQREFCMISVQKHNFLQHWVLKIYVIKSNRRFICYIANEDIIKMNSDFLEMLFPFEMESLNQILTKSTDNIKYDRFSENYKTMRSGIFHSFHSNDNIKYDESLKKRHPFIEMRFWEDLLDNMQLSLNANGKLRLKINTFKGILREFLFHDILQKLNPESLIFLEVFFESRKSKTPINIFNKLPNITYNSANHYNIYIRLTNLQHLGISNEKFTLRDLIYSYSLDLLNQIDTNKLAKTVFLQSELKNLGNFLKFKLQSSDFNRNLLEIVESLNNSKKEIVIKKDLTGKALKRLNCSISLQNINFNKEKKYVLIYKAVFTLRPLKMVTVSFSVHKLIFYVEIYDLKNCHTFSKKFPMFVVKNYMPFIKEMLSWSLFYLIGERMIQNFKNSLIVESFIKFK